MTSKHLYCFCSLFFICASATFAADIPEFPFAFVIGKANIDTPPNMELPRFGGQFIVFVS